MSEGRILHNNGAREYEYFLKDHLGNVRVSLRPSHLSPEVTQENFYYPFGIRIDRTITGEGNKYLYNGKSLKMKMISTGTITAQGTMIL